MVIISPFNGQEENHEMLGFVKFASLVKYASGGRLKKLTNMADKLNWHGKDKNLKTMVLLITLLLRSFFLRQ